MGTDPINDAFNAADIYSPADTSKAREEYSALREQLEGAADLLAEFASHRADSNLAWLDDWSRRVEAYQRTATA